MDIINKNTTLGKGLKTLIWTAGSAALVAVIAAVGKHPELFSPLVVLVVNVLGVTIKNLLDNEVKNY